MFEPLMRARSAPVGDAEETRRAAAASRGEKADVRRPRSEERGHTRLKRVISCDRKPIGAVDSGHAIAMWLVGMCRACTCEQKCPWREAFGRSGRARGCWRCCARVARAGCAEFTCAIELRPFEVSARSDEPNSEPSSTRFPAGAAWLGRTPGPQAQGGQVFRERADRLSFSRTRIHGQK
jgi:hypothetical protein